MIIKQKVAKSISILARARYCIPQSVLLTLYCVLIEPYLMYCNIIWATQNTASLTSLFLSQKRAVRIIAFAHWLSHTKPIFVKYSILTIYDINKLQTACFMFSIMHNLTPKHFGSMFLLNSCVHSHLTRQIHDFHQARFLSNTSKITIRVQGPILWNSLPSELKNLPHLGLFKRHYKFHLLQQYKFDCL